MRCGQTPSCIMSANTAPHLVQQPQHSIRLPSPAILRTSSLQFTPFYWVPLTLFLALIWNILLGIPFSLLIDLANKVFIQWLGYEKIMRCPSGIFASRVLMIVVNLFIIWSWRKQLIKEEKEDRVRAEVWSLDKCWRDLADELGVHRLERWMMLLLAWRMCLLALRYVIICLSLWSGRKYNKEGLTWDHRQRKLRSSC